MPAHEIISQIDAAIGSHGAWKLRLDRAVMTGKADTIPPSIADDDLCHFGRWLHTAEALRDLRQTLPFRVTCQLHADFHKQAGKVVALAAAGWAEQARDLLTGDYMACSDRLLEALIKWRGELERGNAAA